MKSRKLTPRQEYVVNSMKKGRHLAWFAGVWRLNGKTMNGNSCNGLVKKGIIKVH